MESDTIKVNDDIDNEIQNLNKIETVADVESNPGSSTHTSRPQTPLKKRIKSVQNEILSQRYYLEEKQKQFEKEVSQKLDSLVKKLDNLQVDQKRPTPILTRKKDDTTPFHTPPKSPSVTASSGNLSRASSRNVSPERVNGVLPLLQDVIYSNKVLLKEKRSKYNDAYTGIKRHFNGSDTLVERMKNDDKRNDRKMDERMATLVPRSLGIKKSHRGVEHFEFKDIPEDAKDFALGETALKNILKIHSRISKPGEDLRHVFESLIDKYDGRLTASQFKDIVTSICTGEFKNKIRNAFRGKSLDRAIKSILKLYGNVQTPSEKESYFLDLKVDRKNLRPSLIKILEAAYEAYPDMDEYGVAEEAMKRAICSLPEKVKIALNEIRHELKEENALNPEIEKLSFEQFMDLVEKHMYDHDVKTPSAPGIKAVRNVGKSEDSSQVLSGLQQSQSQIVAALTTIHKKFEDLDKNASNVNASTRNVRNVINEDPNKKGQRLSFYKLNDPNFDNALKELSKHGNVLQVIKKEYQYNSKKRGKPDYQLKTVSDPNKRIPYQFDQSGRYIPNTPPIDYPVIVQNAPNAYYFTDRFLERVSRQCIACGSFECGIGAKNCIYNDVDTVCFNVCKFCRQGMHATCLASNEAPPLN